MRKLRRTIAAAAVAAGLGIADAANAQAATYSIAWTGSMGYSLTGQFSFSDALVGTGAIDESDLIDFTFSVFLNGAFQGQWNLGSPLGAGAQPFNFNFDTITETFLVGGAASGPTGQLWNMEELSGAECGYPGVGFASGPVKEGVCVNDYWQGPIVVNNGSTNLVATRLRAEVPEPTTLALFSIGVVGLGLARRRMA